MYHSLGDTGSKTDSKREVKALLYINSKVPVSSAAGSETYQSERAYSQFAVPQ